MQYLLYFRIMLIHIIFFLQKLKMEIFASKRNFGNAHALGRGAAHPRRPPRQTAGPTTPPASPAAPYAWRDRYIPSALRQIYEHL